MGIAPRGIVGHLLEIAHGPLALAPALKVHRELGGNLPGSGAIPRLQPHADALVELPPPRGP